MPNCASSGCTYSLPLHTVYDCPAPSCLSKSSPLRWGIHPLAFRLPRIPGLMISPPSFSWPASTHFSWHLPQECSLVQLPLPSLYLWHLVLRRRIRPRFRLAPVDRAIRCLPSLWASSFVLHLCLLSLQLLSFCLASLLPYLGDRLWYPMLGYHLPRPLWHRVHCRLYFRPLRVWPWVLVLRHLPFSPQVPLLGHLY